MITVSLLAARILAVALPMPEVPPVTRAMGEDMCVLLFMVEESPAVVDEQASDYGLTPCR
jgi:hypothetical protein